MPKKNHNELVAGIFVVLTVALALGIVFWLGLSDYFATKGQVAVFYALQKDGSANLQNGAYVMAGDVSIGQIVGINQDFASGRCIYTVRLDRTDVTIHADGQAQVSSNFLGQARLVIISLGKSKDLADDAHPIKIDSSGMDGMMSKASAAADKLDSMLTYLQEQQVPQDIKKTTSNIAAVTGNINDMTVDAKPKIANTLTSIEDMSKQLDQYAKADIADILSKLRESNTEILKITKNFAEVSQQARDVVVMNRENLDLMINNMTQVSASLKATANEVRRNPWRLLYRPSEKESRQQDIYEAATAFSEGASQLDMAVAKLNGLIKASPNGAAANDPTIQQVLKDLKETFGKFSKAEQALWNELQKQ